MVKFPGKIFWDIVFILKLAPMYAPKSHTVLNQNRVSLVCDKPTRCQDMTCGLYHLMDSKLDLPEVTDDIAPDTDPAVARRWMML